MSEENNEITNEISNLKKEIENLKKENATLKSNSYNFKEFLANSYLNPKILAPFSNKEKQAFAVMDQIGEYLRNLVLNAENLPLVSVIMPTYNRKEVIKHAIDSVLNQTYANFELLIIDDGSEDNTIELLNSLEDDRVRILTNERKQGISFSRNECLRNAEGDIIMYLDSDNMWDSKYIETMVGAFIHLPDADAIYSGQYLFKEYGDENPYAIRFGSYNKTLLHNRNYIDINCFCHKSDVIDKVGEFDENIWQLVDWDLILRISNQLKIYSVPTILCNYYEHDFNDGNANTPFDHNYACEKLFKKHPLPVKEYKHLNKKVSIIIPTYESIISLTNCINSIQSFDYGDMVEIIVVDNNSGIKVLEYLFYKETKENIKLVLNTLDEGVSSAIKKGIDRADLNSDLMILNRDTVLTEGALEHLQHCAYDLPDCGLVVPHEITSKKNKIIPLHVPYADSNFECDTLPSIVYHNIENLNTFHDGELLELNYAPFFCTYIKRDVYNKTLGLNFELETDNIENRIFSDFITNILNLKIYQAPYAYVYHKHVTMKKSFDAKKSKLDNIINVQKNDLNEKAPWDF